MDSQSLHRPQAGSDAGQGASKDTPRYIRMHDNDNVAIVVNDGGLRAGAQFAD